MYPEQITKKVFVLFSFFKLKTYIQNISQSTVNLIHKRSPRINNMIYIIKMHRFKFTNIWKNVLLKI